MPRDIRNQIIRVKMLTSFVLNIAAIFSFCLVLIISSGSLAKSGESKTSYSAIMDLSGFNRVSFSHLVSTRVGMADVYYLDTEGQAVSLNLATGDWGLGEKSADGFLCLIAKNGISLADDTGQPIVAGPLRISACTSKTGLYDVLHLDVVYKSLLKDDIAANEVDTSKALRQGSNIYIADLYQPTRPYQINDEFLEGQRFGDTNEAIGCGSLHLTASDHLGLVIFYSTLVRPHYAGVLHASVADDTPDTKIGDGIHLKIAPQIGFKCEQAALLSKEIAIVVSENYLVAIDREHFVYAFRKLPVDRRSLLIFRVREH